jgi:hypothetical protein
VTRAFSPTFQEIVAMDIIAMYGIGHEQGSGMREGPA